MLQPSQAARSALRERDGDGSNVALIMLQSLRRFALTNQGHDTRALQAYLGHKNIQHTVRYTELAPHRFKDFWR